MLFRILCLISVFGAWQAIAGPVSQSSLVSGIKLVQSDILQLKIKTEVLALAQHSSPYIQKLNIPLLWDKTKRKDTKVANVNDGINFKYPDLQDVWPIFSFGVEVKALGAVPKLALDGHFSKVAGEHFCSY
ncbi:hypothetical protein AAD001_06200 [Colwelliaceae bacterium 6471]